MVERGNITHDLTEIKYIFQKYNKQLHTNKVDMLGEMDKFLRTRDVPDWIRRIRNVNRPIASKNIE